VIEINKEFTDFFDDPQRNYFTGWQSFIFSTFGIIDWGLGLILLAAVSGLTQTDAGVRVRSGLSKNDAIDITHPG
jgi:hypothetical protein